GVTRDDDVMLVGHSEGGLVAVTAARDAVRSGEFRVTHVVTAGSPIGLTADEVPRGVQVLALENAHDLVPHLDGTTNPDRPNVTTVTGDHACAGIIACHEIGESYRPIAGAVDASHNASIRTFLSSAQPYLNATEVQTKTF